MTYVNGVNSNLTNNLDALANVKSRLSAVNTDTIAKELPSTLTTKPETAESSVTLSEAAKSKLAQEQQATTTTESDEGADLKSFTFGALGLDHPDKVEEKEDSSYTAGQYVKAAATIGGMIAMFI
ncbi:Ribosome recycling factor [Shewanella piezotolerans WP3]|uniref:Ribosome recycling factor n=1 Tax=Shewanella piezotolerans (strain WP3 / JCM 13877) TaxID=225849 RepID=B8CJ10_SHEPW|nr:hypothetical protein [Shewanella piezotolerans]ACJ27636.1 Ribosome recycling factor [Shewanella piezotolerans WP3]